MWLAPDAALLAADAGGSSSPVSLYVVGAIAALSTILAAWLAMRGTLRTADNAREVAFDAQVDADRAALRAQLDRALERCETHIAERDAIREKYVRLRVAFVKHGLDPDNL